MAPYRILLADDHTLFRKGIRNIIEGASDLEVVGEAGDGLDLLDVLKKQVADLVILDISMPNLRGIEATREIKIIAPKVKILILTMHKDKEFVCHAVRAGAEGYLLKEDADTELFTAINKLREGDHYISPLLSGKLTFELILATEKGQAAEPSDNLTLREREVLKLIAEGGTNKEIAEALSISVRTVENHRANTMRKLNIKKTANLVKYAIRHSYISPKR
jgi:DNA-binding NarL/FixJ family response regulator